MKQLIIVLALLAGCTARDGQEVGQGDVKGYAFAEAVGVAAVAGGDSDLELVGHVIHAADGRLVGLTASAPGLGLRLGTQPEAEAPADLVVDVWDPVWHDWQLARVAAALSGDSLTYAGAVRGVGVTVELHWQQDR